jgi:ribose 5-phosphate isomerase A
MSEQDDLKKIAADWAVEHLPDDVLLGPGSGTTAALAIRALGRRVRTGFQVTGVPTSERTAVLARELGIPLSTLSDHPSLDFTLDRADEVDVYTCDLIKGGGGKLLREKSVATASKMLVIIIDESKTVDRLGTRSPVPVVVVQFGWESTSQRLA